MSQTQPIDGDAVDLIARQRIRTHEQADNRRPAFAADDLEAERVGAAAEAAFALRYDLPPPSHDLVDGDDGSDYDVRYNDSRLNVEIKASKYDDPSLMLSDEYKHDAVDRYVLASVDWPTEVEFIGWIRQQRIDDVSSREPSQFGGFMDVVEGDDLIPIPDESDLSPAEDP